VRTRFLALADAEPDEAVVVVDVLRAFTTVPWLHHRGVARVFAVDTPERATALRDDHLPGALLAGEVGGRPLPGFDLGNSPTEVAATALPLAGGTVIHRTSAGTQGLVRCLGSRWLFAASFVNAAATVAALRDTGASRVTFVITGASLGRNGDEDLACAELLAARLAGEGPDPGPFLARVASSDAGRVFGPDGPDWAPASDLAAACELDRFPTALSVGPWRRERTVEVRQLPITTQGG
jgi:2-phosphosulfolactate phosphatase